MRYPFLRILVSGVAGVLLLSCEEKNWDKLENGNATVVVEFDSADQLVVSSGERQFRPGIERSLSRVPYIRLIPYKARTLLYISGRRSFALYLLQERENLPLLKELLAESVLLDGGGKDDDSDGVKDLRNALTGLCIGQYDLGDVSDTGGLEILFDATREITPSIPDMPNGAYSVRLVCDLKKDRLVCLKKLAVGVPDIATGTYPAAYPRYDRDKGGFHLENGSPQKPDEEEGN